MDQVNCTKCGALILTRTAEKNNGLCLPCKTGTRESIEAAKRRRAEAALKTNGRMPYQIIADMMAKRAALSDDEVLAELASLPPLVDEDDDLWNSEQYWLKIAYPYVALADVAALRRLRPAIQLLLERACYGDPGEIMRGLRHNLERIVEPNWTELADACLQAAQSPRLGTRLWAIDELVILEDARAEPVFEQAIKEGPDEIRWRAKIGMERLLNKQQT